MFTRNVRGIRRVSPPVYKFLLAAHIIVAVGWLGIVSGKLVLGLVAVTTDTPGLAADLHTSMRVIDVAFPPVAIATLVTGVLLSLGTKWGLFRHYWVATKLALALAVIVTATQLGNHLLATLVALAVAHVLMLVVATVVSVYKPWGKTPWGRRNVGRASGRRGGRRADARLIGTTTR